MNNITEAFKDKTLVITGGTGSFGSTVLKHFLTTDIGEIRIISRDEKKQDWMRHSLQAKHYITFQFNCWRQVIELEREEPISI